MIGNGKNLKVTHSGSFCLPTITRPFHISNVLCVPKMKKNLLSVYQLCKSNNVSVEFSHVSDVVKDYLTEEHLVRGKPKYGVYPWPSTASSPWASHTQLVSTAA